MGQCLLGHHYQKQTPLVSEFSKQCVCTALVECTCLLLKSMKQRQVRVVYQYVNVRYWSLQLASQLRLSIYLWYPVCLDGMQCSASGVARCCQIIHLVEVGASIVQSSQQCICAIIMYVPCIQVQSLCDMSSSPCWVRDGSLDKLSLKAVVLSCSEGLGSSSREAQLTGASQLYSLIVLVWSLDTRLARDAADIVCEHIRWVGQSVPILKLSYVIDIGLEHIHLFQFEQNAHFENQNKVNLFHAKLEVCSANLQLDLLVTY